MKICNKCSGCGFYADYGGFNKIISTSCKKCEGAGWVNEDGTPYKPEPTTGTITILVS